VHARAVAAVVEAPDARREARHQRREDQHERGGAGEAEERGPVLGQRLKGLTEGH
jgi:hypothetical protein